MLSSQSLVSRGLNRNSVRQPFLRLVDDGIVIGNASFRSSNVRQNIASLTSLVVAGASVAATFAVNVAEASSFIMVNAGNGTFVRCLFEDGKNVTTDPAFLPAAGLRLCGASILNCSREELVNNSDSFSSSYQTSDPDPENPGFSVTDTSPCFNFTPDFDYGLPCNNGTQHVLCEVAKGNISASVFMAYLDTCLENNCKLEPWPKVAIGVVLLVVLWVVSSISVGTYTGVKKWQREKAKAKANPFMTSTDNGNDVSEVPYAKVEDGQEQEKSSTCSIKSVCSVPAKVLLLPFEAGKKLGRFLSQQSVFATKQDDGMELESVAVEGKNEGSFLIDSRSR